MYVENFMNYLSYLKKLKAIFYLTVIYPNHFVPPNFYLFNITHSDILSSKHILFYFNDLDFMHLGDHLFFVPCIMALMQDGFQVVVFPIPTMAEFFKALSIPIITRDADFSGYDVIISRAELAQKFKNQKSILIDVSKNLTKPIADELTHHVRQLFSQKTSPAPFRLMLTFNQSAFRWLLDPKKKYIVFNCYIDSGFYRVTRKKINLIVRFAKKLANDEKYEIIFIGSEKNRLSDKNTYSFPLIDLRGKTNVMDVFALAGQRNVQCFVGFDSFPMHVFSLMRKKSYVVFRGRFFKKHHEMIQRSHLNLFAQDCFVTELKKTAI